MPRSAAASSPPTIWTVFWFSLAHSLSFAVFSMSGSASAATASVRFGSARVPIFESFFDAATSRPPFFVFFLPTARRSASLRSSSRASFSLWSSSPSAATRRAMASGLALSSARALLAASSLGLVLARLFVGHGCTWSLGGAL